MKETVNVNIGKQVFVLDRDAYGVLKSYLDDIKSRLPKDDTETIGDIETRIAEILREKISSQMISVSREIINAVMVQMGAPSDFGERTDEQRGVESESEQPQAPHKLYRSIQNRSIAGVCGGLAEFFDIDATMLRIVTLLLILFGGLSIWVYVILWIVVPQQPYGKFWKTTNTNR